MIRAQPKQKGAKSIWQRDSTLELSVPLRLASFHLLLHSLSPAVNQSVRLPLPLSHTNRETISPPYCFSTRVSVSLPRCTSTCRFLLSDALFPELFYLHVSMLGKFVILSMCSPFSLRKRSNRRFTERGMHSLKLETPLRHIVVTLDTKA